jgi:cyanuric acid amidohydrolase
MRVDAFNIPTAHPADVSDLERLIAEGRIRPEEVVCIIGKTEGNGGRNDFTRDLAMLAFENLFARHLGTPHEMIFSLSGGTEGIVSPHIIVFTRSDGTAQADGKRLVIGTGHTREFAAAEIGRMPQIEETARVIADIVQGLGVAPADVHLIQMKGAIPPGGGRSNMVYSRGASALGAALALGEVDRAQLSDDVVCEDWSLYSSVASCSAKPGLTRTEIMVMANSASADGDLVIDHAVLQDMLDVRSMHALFARLGLDVDQQLTEEQRKRLVGIFAKSEADPRGTIRGKRHTMLTDDDISDTRYSRCVLSSVIAAVTGEPAVYVSTRAEHHGPLGGGTMAVIARVSS